MLIVKQVLVNADGTRSIKIVSTVTPSALRSSDKERAPNAPAK